VTAPGVLEDLFTRLRPVPSSVMNGYQNITAFHFFFVLLRFIFLHSHADQLMIAALMQSRSPVQLIYVSTLKRACSMLAFLPGRH
jgi:hypothetical protein